MPRAQSPEPIEVHHPVPLPPPHAAALTPVQPGAQPAVQSVQLPDGRIVTGYTLTPTPPPATAHQPAVSRTAVNVALGGIGFAAVCGGLLLLASFLAALAALVHQLIILAAIVFGGWIAAQVLHPRRPDSGGTVVNIRRAIFKRNHFHH
ncbi:hypothetical protein [Streptomyces orinoci]|uniref:Integral membrane protein n=1 Tax=Streptomyces orinoci TaxID=67339 RepID=A0ABV3JPR8_STRON|nr:hypothetical protein [Streptomyces orinoci]